MHNPTRKQLRDHLALVRHAANQQRLTAYLGLFFTGDAEQASRMYHDAVHTDVYGDKVWAVLLSTSELAANSNYILSPPPSTPPTRSEHIRRTMYVV